MRYFALLLLIISLSACKPISTPPSTTKLILRAELREIRADIIREFRFFENATVEETIIYAPKTLFTTRFYKLNPQQLKNLQNQILELSSKPHQNEFPWKEDFYERGDVIKFEYAGKDGLPYSVYYYTGHEGSEPIFKSLYQIIINHANTESLFTK